MSACRQRADPLGDVDIATAKPRREAPRKVIACRSCDHVLSFADAAIEVAGAHRHTCVNPSGIVYRIRCFALAPGCRGFGERSTYFSWFAGYGWQISLCGNCQAHVGWGFRHGETSSQPLRGDAQPFFGLIADRIHERDLPADEA